MFALHRAWHLILIDWMFRKLFIVVGLLLLPAFTLAQSEREQARSEVTLNETAVQVAKQLNDSKLLAITYYQLGHIYSDRNLFPQAIASYEKSKDGFERAGLTRDEVYVLADLGALYFIQEDYQKARECSEGSLRIAESANSSVPAGAFPDEFGKARALLNLGDLDTHEGNYEHAVEELQNSLALYQRLNGSSSSYDLYIAGVYGALGRAYPEIGDSTTGLLCLNKALDIADHHSDKRLTASLRNDIGYLYLEQEDYAQASAQFGESLKIYEAEKNQRERGRVLLNLGVVEQRRSNYEYALRYFRLSIENATITGALDNQIAASEGIGAVLSSKRDFPGAIDVLNKGLAIAKNTSNKTRQTEILWRLAQVNYEMGDYAQSTALAEAAFALARASHLSKLTYLATTTLGESYAAQQKYVVAIETLTEAVRQLESMRERVAGSELETEMFLENKIASYDALVNLLIKQDKPVDALVYAERAKGRVLLDVLRDGKPDLAKALTPAEKAETQRLNRRISEIGDTIRKQESANSSPLNSLYDQLDAARVEYRSFQDALYVTHPNLRIRSGDTASLSAGDLNALTADNTAYLEYVVAKDGVSLFVLSKNKSNGTPEVKVYPIAINKSEDLNRKVNEFHDALAEQRLAYTTAARELHTLLIAPAEQQLRGVGTICIVPDSFLWNLPFQALMTPREHFLIEDHALYYAPSLSVLREMTRKKATSENPNSSLIAFGNPVVGKDEQRNADLCPLPEAEQEVSSIAKSFDEKNSKVFIGRDASEKAFKTLAPTYSIIHLATHGVIDNRQPLYSHLLLTKTENDPENDGRLEARQIMDMNLNADLAVLSACETANGKVAPGEGVIGMSWAFFVSGTRSMLVTQWRVNSAGTSQYMVKFYRSLESKGIDSPNSKATALREAALALLNEKRYQHPFYWAAFVMIGTSR
jgi:CHAT domain-containing protein/lipopolysaccharide biosynthesis regulator YciM